MLLYNCVCVSVCVCVCVWGGGGGGGGGDMGETTRYTLWHRMKLILYCNS